MAGTAIPTMTVDSPASTRRIATFTSYAEAEQAVDLLADRKFPVQHVSVVGRGLKTIEQVTGRRGLGTDLLRGAVNGALVGALAGWFFSLFGWTDPLVAALTLMISGLVIGALIGALFGAIGYLITRGPRDFSSVSAMRAESYDLLVDEEHAADAERVLNAGRAEH